MCTKLGKFELYIQPQWEFSKNVSYNDAFFCAISYTKAKPIEVRFRKNAAEIGVLAINHRKREAGSTFWTFGGKQ